MKQTKTNNRNKGSASHSPASFCPPRVRRGVRQVCCLKKRNRRSKIVTTGDGGSCFTYTPTHNYSHILVWSVRLMVYFTVVPNDNGRDCKAYKTLGFAFFKRYFASASYLFFDHPKANHFGIINITIAPFSGIMLLVSMAARQKTTNKASKRAKSDTATATATATRTTIAKAKVTKKARSKQPPPAETEPTQTVLDLRRGNQRRLPGDSKRIDDRLDQGTIQPSIEDTKPRPIPASLSYHGLQALGECMGSAMQENRLTIITGLAYRWSAGVWSRRASSACSITGLVEALRCAMRLVWTGLPFAITTVMMLRRYGPDLERILAAPSQREGTGGFVRLILVLVEDAKRDAVVRQLCHCQRR